MAIDKNYSQKLYCSTAKMTEEEWENERRKALGGSDMAVVLGMSPFEGTRLSVYNEKTGKKPVEPMEDKTRVIFDSGHFLEKMVANLFDYRSGYETYEVKAMFEHLHHPYLRGNIDRFYRRHGEKAPLGFLECKTTSEFNSGWGNDNIPMHYKIQLSTYLSILNMDMCQIACLKLPESLRWVAGVLYQMKRVFGKLPANVLGDIRDQLNAVASSELKPYVPMVLSVMGGAFLIPERLRAECSDAISTAFFMRSYERDEILEEYILEEAEKFWHNHVEKHISPSLENETGANAMSTLRKYTPRFHASTPVMMPHEAQLADCYRQMTELNERKSALSKRTKEITEQIQKLSVPFVIALNGADRGTFSYDGNSYEVVYSGGERVSIPKKKYAVLQNAYPDAYNAVVETTVTNPSLKVKKLQGGEFMKVQVERVLYDSPDTGFHICKAAVLEATQEDNIPKPLLGSLDMLTIKGYFPVSKIVELLVKGSWEKSKYGYVLVVNEFKEIIPPTKEGIIAYLSATVYGIKESMAKKIVSQFGLQTLEVFEHSPEQLMAVKGIGRQRLEKIIESYKDSRSIQEIVSYLAPLGVTANKCAKIAKTFGGEAMNILLNEPFRLCEIDGFGFLIVDQIARKTTFSLTDPMRICGAIRYVLQAAAGDGHLCYEQNVCICYAYLLLNDVDYKNARVAKAVEEYFNTLNLQCLRQFVPKTYVPMSLVIEQFKTMALGYELKGDNGYVYLPFEYEQEVDIANMIAKRLTDGRQTPVPDEEITKAIQAQEQSMNILLAEKQKEAVMLGVKENTCIITGGPGVGKTTVLKVVLSVCLQFGKLSPSDVTLLAPTGRAAQRMAESVGDEYTASTIHSALKIDNDDPRMYEPLDSKIVVVDEASMVDNHLCWLLLNAIPASAKLIMIGDSEHLPSVGAGNVLFEFLNCKRIPTVRLDVIYRQEGTNSIVTNSGLIQYGVSKLRYDENFQFFDVSATDVFPASDKERGAKIQTQARDIVIEQFLKAVATDGLDEVHVLCSFRKKGVIAGATELNKEIQQRLIPPSYGKPEIKRGDRVFRLGDKVIQTKNNKDIGIYNGDVGYIRRIDTAEDEIEVCFIGSNVTIDSTQLVDLDLAYAISIHKAQGSEYNQIIIPVLTAFSIMLKRNLIYTGITRAKKKVVLVGHKRALAQAIRTNVIATRNTQLGRRIIAKLNTQTEE